MSKNEKNSSPKMGKNKHPMGGEKAKDFKGTIKQLTKYLKEFKVAIIFVVIFAIASAAFAIIGPKLLGNATTEIFNGLVSKITGSGGGIDFTAIGKILIFLVCLYCASALFSFVQGLITVQISQKVSYNMRDELSKKINRMPMRYFDGKTYGDVLSRVTNDVDTISQTLNQGLTEIIGSVTTLIGVLIMMFSISFSMSIVSLIVVPISLGLIMGVVKKSQKHFKAQQEYLGKINGHIEETYAGHNIVKVFNNEENTIAKFDEYNDVLYSSAWKSQFLSGMM
ncbi:MAG: ABC transporter ATP-binding protein, partial [Oscillospiraceae bacterium]